MCLISIAQHASPRWALVLAANRDEFYARPTRPAHVWEDDARIVGGRDLQAGGSWLALRRGGRVAAVTNVRGVGRAEGGPSRGLLVSQFVRGDQTPAAYAESIDGDDYAGFHLIVGDGELVHRWNSGPIATIEGLFAVSNAPPEAHWEKVDIARDYLASAIERHDRADDLASALLRFLSTPRGGPIQQEIFVSLPIYGTRSSTVIIIEPDGKSLFVEQNYGVGRRVGEAVRFLRYPAGQ